MQPENQNENSNQDPNVGVTSEPQNTPQPTQMYAPEPIEEPAPEPERVPLPADKIIDNTPITWSADEYISQEKNKLWYVIFGVVVALFIALDLLVIKSYTFSVLVLVMATSVIVFARRPPRQIKYTLSGGHGLYIDEKLYHFNDFKSFGVIQNKEQYSIMLIPVKRFSPAISVYFPRESGEQIVDIFGKRLPMENLKLDFVDILVQKLRL